MVRYVGHVCVLMVLLFFFARLAELFFLLWAILGPFLPRASL